MSYPDGSTIKTCLTPVLHREDGDWRHMHVSVGVPDEEVVVSRIRR